MNGQFSGIPTCPGCHFGCTLDDYQCARGKKFYARWEHGEPIPERRQPGAAPKADGTPSSERDNPQSETRPGMPPHLAHAPASVRCMLLLTIAQNVLRDREDAARANRVAECILRQDGSATNRIIAERTRLSDEQIDEQIAMLQGQGLVTSSVDERGRTFHELTESGRMQTKTWFEEHRAADAEFFGTLDDDEMEQLELLLAKVLAPYLKRGPQGNPRFAK